MNHPVRRIVGAAHLASRYLKEGFLDPLRGLVLLGDCNSLGQGLMAYQEGSRGSETLIGEGRARDIVVNVVLPFFHAWSTLTGDIRVKARSVRLYREHPPLQDNQVLRAVEGQFLGKESGRLADTARRQQGLLYLYRALVSQGQ